MKTKLSITCSLLIALIGRAQDPSFSQFNSVPIYFNPSFAGSAEKSRLAVDYRNQWNSTYETGYVSYDQAVKKLHGGVGILAYNDFGTISTFYSGLIYAPKFNLFGKISISPSIKIGYLKKSLNIDNLTFGNQIDPKRGFVYASNEPLLSKSVANVDISTGILINTEKFYAGFALDHINEPNLSFTNGESKLPMKYVIQAGYTFQANDSSSFSVTPNLLYQRQGMFDLLQGNVVSRYKWTIVGIGYSNSHTFTTLLGYYSKKFVVGYSLDYYTNLKAGFSAATIAHEISMKYFFTWKRNTKMS